MRNQAKCKLCNSIIESLSPEEYAECQCGEISVSGGNDLKCSAKNWNNFCRIDDEGNEVVISVKNDSSKPSKKEMIGMIDDMAKNIERLPSSAMLSPITHYDFVSLLMLLSSILKSDRNDAS